MDVKKIALMGGMMALAGIVFLQIKKMGTPPPAPTPVERVAAPVVQQAKLVKILVASQNIYMGSRLTEDMLEWRDWPEEALSEVFISKPNTPDAMTELAGSIVRSEIGSGEPVVLRKLVQAGNRSVMSALLKPGMRAVSVRITTDTAASGFINPGDRVDIILTKRIPGTKSNVASFSTQTVFENVEVLAIDQTYTAGEDGSATVVGSVALFQLSQLDAELLTAADSSGDLSLTLRGLSNSRGTPPRSAALMQKSEETKVSSLKIYRDGKSEQVLLKEK
jgi:pilus assembly protein CpaB